MPRIRSIKPEFFTSLAVASLPLEARLTFIGLWTHVDDEGRAVDDARLIKAALWPLDDRLAADVEGDLKLLSESSLIVRYKVGERSFLAVKNWGEHQRINRPTPSRLPSPADADKSPDPPPATRTTSRDNANLNEPSATTHGGITEGSREERKGKEQGKELKPPALASLDAEPLAGEIGDDPPPPDPAAVALFAVPAGTDLDIAEPSNAGQLNRQWIDYCKANGVKLSNSVIKRYGGKLKQALDDGFDTRLIKHALGAMFKDRVASRPALLDSYLVRVQQGPELPPERLTAHQAAAERLAAPGKTATEQLYDTLTRPA